MDREFYDELVKENKRKKISIIVTVILLFILTIVGILIYNKVSSKNYLKETIINIFDYKEEKGLVKEVIKEQTKLNLMEQLRIVKIKHYITY